MEGGEQRVKRGRGMREEGGGRRGERKEGGRKEEGRREGEEGAGRKVGSRGERERYIAMDRHSTRKNVQLSWNLRTQIVVKVYPMFTTQAYLIFLPALLQKVLVVKAKVGVSIIIPRGEIYQGYLLQGRNTTSDHLLRTCSNVSGCVVPCFWEPLRLEPTITKKTSHCGVLVHILL